MAAYTIQSILLLTIVIAFIAGAIVLQFFLSKRGNKWLGLILPLIIFIFSIILVIDFPKDKVYVGPVTIVQILDEDGSIINQYTEARKEVRMDLEMPAKFQLAAVVFLFANTPTIILLAIYAGCWKKRK